MEKRIESEPKPKKKKKAASGQPLVEQVQDNYNMLKKMIAVSEKALQERLPAWKRYRKKYRRGLFYLKNSGAEPPLYFTNYIYSNVETLKSNLTLHLPELSVRPKGSEDDRSAEILGKVLADSLKQAQVRQHAKAVVHSAAINCMGWFKVWFDTNLERGAGNNVIDSVLPEDMLLDPVASTLEDLRWAIHRIRDVSEDKIFAQYGEIPEPENEEDDEVGEDDIVMDNGKGYDESSDLGRPGSEIGRLYDVYECWVRDWNPEAPNQWYIVTLAGKTILRSEYSVYNHNQLPFIPWFDVEDEFAENLYKRGVGEIEEIEPLQDRADSLDARIYHNIKLLSNRQRYVSLQSGLNINAMDNTSGRTYGVNGDPQKAVYYDVPPQLSSDVFGYRNSTEQLIQGVSGLFDVTQGKRPTGIIAGKAIEQLKDSADVRITDRAESFALVYQKVGELCLRNVLQFFDAERIIRATDADSDVYLRVIGDYPASLQPQAMPIEDENGEPVVDENGEPQFEDGEVDEMLRQTRQQWREANQIDLVLSDISYDFDIEADTDNALPASRAERMQVASDFFRLGAIDREALLKAASFPEYKQILQRIAAEATGKTAGDPMTEAGMGGQQGVDQLAGILQSMGLPPELVDQILMQMAQGAGQQPQTPAQQTGNFPPQIMPQ